MPRGENYPAADRFDERDAGRRARSDDRDYGRYVETDEGQSSVRAGSWDQGRTDFGSGREPARDTYHRDSPMVGGQPSWSEGGPMSPDHRGKGPKGYTRSDETVKERISEHLRADPRIDASDITVTVQDGKATFEGSVEERWMRHAAEYIAESAGAADIDNKLRVGRAKSSVENE
jgi:hypothetical protein